MRFADAIHRQFLRTGPLDGDALPHLAEPPPGRKTDWLPKPALYPSRALLSAYRQKDADFRAFLDRLPGSGDFTLLCFEPANAPCHRRSAAAWLLERVPALTLGRLR